MHESEPFFFGFSFVVVAVCDALTRTQTGYAQVALSYCCRELERKATVFTAGTTTSDMSRLAQSFGGHIVGVPGNLEATQARADAYVRQDATRRCLLPFGVESEEFRAALVENVRRALPRALVDRAPSRVWLAVGSGTLLRALGCVWPTSKFMPVRVGKNVWEDQFSSELWQRLGGRRRLDELRAVDDAKLTRVSGLKYYNFAAATAILPPYRSVDCYDAKIWERLLRFGNDGDLVWNVAANEIKT